MRNRLVAFGLCVGAAVALSGCGGGLTLALGGLDTTARATPLVGTYRGVVDGSERHGAIEFTLRSNGTATGVLRVGSTSVLLTGEVDDDRRIELRAGGRRVVGEFRGAAHPLDSSYYVSSGVRFLGSWYDGDERRGAVEAWHIEFPPPLPPSYDPFPAPSPPTGGGGGGTGSAGGSDGGASGPGDGFVPPLPGGGPQDPGGDSLPDDIIWRRNSTTQVKSTDS